MGEIPRVDWLDQLVFRGVEKRGLQASSTSLKALQRRRSRQRSTVMTLDGTGEKATNGNKEDSDEDLSFLYEKKDGTKFMR